MNFCRFHIKWIVLALPLVWMGQGFAGDRTIRLGRTQLEPEEGFHAAGLASEEPFIVQFYRIPNASRRDSLRARGVILDRYAGGGAYIARCDGNCVPWLADDSSVRATVKLSPAMKRSPVFDTDPHLVSLVEQGRDLALDVVFFEGTRFEKALEILQENGIVVGQSGFGFRNSVMIEATWQKLLRLLEYPELKWVDPALPDAAPATVNAAERTRVDQVRERPGFLGADGSGVKVGVWDWFPERSHTDLEDRVTWVNVVPGQSDHGQLVSGVIAGAGLLDPRAKGMAPKAELYWHTLTRETVWLDMQAVKASHGITITSNAWSIKSGWWANRGEAIPFWENNPWVWGYYHEFAAGADELVRLDDLLLVFAAANQRGYSHLGPHYHSSAPPYGVLYGDVHPPNPLVMSVFGPALAKNVLAVGAVSKDEVIRESSCRGPTADGRVKPDVVAPGLELFVTGVDDGYTLASGTSLSAPVVSGDAALLSDYWRRRLGDVPTSLELKNLLIHSARDLGTPGPDYAYGHGLIDAELAARMLDAASLAGWNRRGTRERISLPTVTPATRQRKFLTLSGELDHGSRHSSRFRVPRGVSQLRATLVWHDPAGDVLVNDLDLWFEGPDGSVVRPFVLDRENPSQPASRGRNRVDNVESILVENPAAASWRVIVEGARVAMAPERYSLMVSASGGNGPLVLLTEGECEILDFYTTLDDESVDSIRPWTTFTAGDPLNIYFAFAISENADYGDYFGSLTLVGSITNQDGDVIFKIDRDTHQGSAADRLEGLSTGIEIPEGLPLGRYTAHLKVRMHNAFECTADYQFSVD